MVLLTEVEKFAVHAHGQQKYGEHPYTIHLEHVQRVLQQEGFGDDPILSAAAWLHDVVEDTSVSLEQIQERFGDAVADIVFRVTDEAGNSRKERKLKTYPKIKGHREATIIKLCDRIANVEASQSTPKKLKMYKSEYSEFKQNLYVPLVADKLWQRLDKLLDS